MKGRHLDHWGKEGTASDHCRGGPFPWGERFWWEGVGTIGRGRAERISRRSIQQPTLNLAKAKEKEYGRVGVIPVRKSHSLKIGTEEKRNTRQTGSKKPGG